MKNKILALALGAVSVLAIVSQPDKTGPQAGQVQIEPTKVARGSGNAKKYIAKFLGSDGGIVYRTVASPGCVRRRAGAPVTACRWNHPTRGLIDQGQLNRFPQSQAQGGRCQPVACSVFFGEPADLNDDQILDAGY